MICLVLGTPSVETYIWHSGLFQESFVWYSIVKSMLLVLLSLRWPPISGTRLKVER